MRALVLTSGGSIAAQVLSAWLGAGNSITALWIGPKSLRRFLQRDFVLGSQWSVGALAKRFNLPVRRHPDFRNWPGAVDNIRKLRPEVLITVATGQIVPENIISAFYGRAVNFHASLLPHYKGPNPRAGMILDGTAELYGGVTVHCLSPNIDGGDIIGIRKVPFEQNLGFIFWEVCLARAAASLVGSELHAYLNGTLRPYAQPPMSGTYRRIRSRELIISTRTPATRVRWLCDNLGSSGWLRFRSQEKRHYHVSHFIRYLGLPTGKREKVRRLTIKFDASNARVQVARSGAWTRMLRTASYLLAIMRTWRANTAAPKSREAARVAVNLRARLFSS